MNRFLRALVAIAVPRREREWILGDIEEEVAAIEHERGARAARRWLRGETLRVVAGSWRNRRMTAPPEVSLRRGLSMSTVTQDVTYAFRMVRRSPGFTAAAVITLAIGIAANTTIFSVADAVLMKPLPYAAPDRLVRVFDTHERQPRFPVSPAGFLEYRAASSFVTLAAYERNDLQLAGDRPEQLRGMAVTPGFFALLGWQPEIGRDFIPEEEVPGRTDAVIFSHAFWMRRFSGNPALVGRTVRLSDRPYVVVGVLREGFQHVGATFRSYAHGDAVDVWSVRKIQPVPTRFDRTAHFLNVVGRLRDGVTLDSAREELRGITARLGQQYPGLHTGWGAWITPLRDEIVGPTEPLLLVLVVAVQIVLVLACVNVAGLLLGRAAGRIREVGVRAALGATRARLVRQFAVESVVLASAGGLAGVALAAVLIRLVPLVGPRNTPRLPGVALDWTVLLYAASVTLATAVLFGLAPALHLARRPLAETLGSGGRGSSDGNRRFRGVLASAEVALAFVLVVSAGLLVRSFARLSSVDPGFRAQGVLTARVNLPAPRYPDIKASGAFYLRTRDRLLSLPGVRGVGFGTDLPWTGYDENSPFTIAGRSFPSARSGFLSSLDATSHRPTRTTPLRWW
jgi:predicted permease